MRRAVRPFCVALLLVCLAACVNVHPRYRAESVIWDDSLIGSWQAADKQGGVISLVIEPRVVAIDPADQRINPDQHVAHRAVGSAEVPAGTVLPAEVSQYLLRYTTNDSTTWTIEGYLVEAEGHRFLAFQIQDEYLEENSGWVLPVHLLWKIEQTPDQLAFFSPVDAVGWIPGIEWADAADDGGDRPIQRRTGPARGIRIAESLDRVLAYHAEHADDPDFWQQDQGMIFRRR